LTDTRDTIPSVVERTRSVAAGAPVVAAHFLGETAVLALGEETLLLVAPDGAEQRVAVHGGAILAAASDGQRLVTGGDDGKVVATTASGESTVLATDAKHRWIDHVATGPNGAVAWSSGKQAFVRAGKDAERALELPSTPGGLAFTPKGLRLAIAHYNGVTLWFPNAQTEPERLAWKGSHLGVTVSPDGRFVVTTMQEPMLHGWRLADAKDMRMSGYSARVRSLAWTPGGKWLATSGSNQLVLWPFQAKDGPMGKAPLELGTRGDAMVTCVACHPSQEVVAIGYDDGMVLASRFADQKEVLLRRPGKGAVTSMMWDREERRIVFGSAAGDCGVIDIAA
jgi:WD40 repeat protein